MTELENLTRVPGGGFVERLALRIGAAADASHIFGAPVERDGLTVIPVARAAYGFGGGSRGRQGEEGAGGGGGMALTPVGFIEVGAEGALFRRFRDPLALLPVVAVSGLLTLWAMRRMIRPARG